MPEYKNIVPDYNEYVKMQKETFCSHEDTVPKWESGQKRYLNETFANIDRTKKILDIACGDGVGLRTFKEMGFTDVIGVEFNGEKILKASEVGYHIYQCDMHHLIMLEDNEFDIVYCSHTLEHAYYPEKATQELRRVLKPEGTLYIVLPYPDTGDDRAHGGKYTLGTNIKDDGITIVNFFLNLGFNLVNAKYDTFREPEVWLEVLNGKK